MKRVIQASASKANMSINRLRRYAVSDRQIVDTLCAKLIDHMDDDPEMTFEDAYYYLLVVDWEDGLYPSIKERLKEMNIWTQDDATIRDVIDPYFNK